jgi:hypothetical protein
MFKKIRPARPQFLGCAERTKVREHNQGARTQLAEFFNIP